MGAPKGNQYGLGGTTGRPRRFTDQEIEQIADEVVEWARTTDSVIYRKFFADKLIAPSVMHSLKERSKAFANAIELAKYIVGVRREEKHAEGKINDKAFCSYAAIYDPEMKDWLLEQKRSDDRSKLTKIIIQDGRGNMRIDKTSSE
jgi:hypothetical protein